MLTTVIPVYNVEKYLEPCIQSVLDQSYEDMEILLINDGSTDSSGLICQKYEAADRRIRYIKKENEGSGATRNLGITLARGERITFLDADDWWDRNYAKKMMACAQNADIVICDLCYVDEAAGGRQEHVSEIRMPNRIAQMPKEDPDLINKGRTFLCGKVFRTELFRRYEIRQPSMAINDIPIVPLLIALSGRVCRVGEPLYYYLRTREGNTVTSVRALQSFGTALKSMRENFDRFSLTESYGTALRKMYYSQIRFACRKAKSAFASGRMNEQEYRELKEYLFCIIGDFWPDWPNPDGKRFQSSQDEDINQAVRNILFDDAMLTEAKPFDYTVLNDRAISRRVADKKDETEIKNRTGKVIMITKKEGLSGEDLWWQMADDLLFQL